jgi:hypothetical protein
LLAVGGAATLLIDSAGATLMAAGRARSLLAFGWANFAAYAAAVWVTAPLGLTAVAAAAAIAHSAFVFVAYYLMFPEAPRAVPKKIWADVAPALVPCVALVGAGVPVSIAMSAIGPASVIYLSIVGAVSAAAYALALHALFPASWASVVRMIGHLAPRPLRDRRARRFAMAPRATVIVEPSEPAATVEVPAPPAAVES